MGKTKRQQVRWEGGSADDSFDVSNPTGNLIPLSKLSSQSEKKKKGEGEGGGGKATTRHEMQIKNFIGKLLSNSQKGMTK